MGDITFEVSGGTAGLVTLTDCAGNNRGTGSLSSGSVSITLSEDLSNTNCLCYTVQAVSPESGGATFKATPSGVNSSGFHVDILRPLEFTPIGNLGRRGLETLYNSGFQLRIKNVHGSRTVGSLGGEIVVSGHAGASIQSIELVNQAGVPDPNMIASISGMSFTLTSFSPIPANTAYTLNVMLDSGSIDHQFRVDLEAPYNP